MGGPQAPVARVACLLDSKWRKAESAQLFRQALAYRRKNFGDRNPETLYALGWLSSSLGGQGKWAEAADCSREAVEGTLALYGDAHTNTILSTAQYADALYALGRLDECEGLIAPAYERARVALGEGNVTTVSAGNTHGRLIMIRRMESAARSPLIDCLRVADRRNILRPPPSL